MRKEILYHHLIVDCIHIGNALTLTRFFFFIFLGGVTCSNTFIYVQSRQLRYFYIHCGIRCQRQEKNTQTLTLFYYVKLRISLVSFLNNAQPAVSYLKRKNANQKPCRKFCHFVMKLQLKKMHQLVRFDHFFAFKKTQITEMYNFRPKRSINGYFSQKITFQDSKLFQSISLLHYLS